MSPKTMPMQATAAGAQARVAPEGAAVPIFAVALIKSGPEPLTKYTASPAIRKCLGKKPCKGLIAYNMSTYFFPGPQRGASLHVRLRQADCGAWEVLPG